MFPYSRLKHCIAYKAWTGMDKTSAISSCFQIVNITVDLTA